MSLILAENPGEEVKQIKANQAKMAALNDDQAARRILDLALSLVR